MTLLVLLPLAAVAQPPKFDGILYGASYYHEYMPSERLEKDVELMQAAKLSVMRLGESTWSSWEPREGEFQFDWMQRILDRLHKAGIKAILGTPTYSIPPWLYQKHPEIVVNRAGAAQPLGEDRYEPAYPWRVPPGGYGIRQNTDLTHPVYRWYSERIIRAVVSRFKDHPAVIGFQVDNETHPNISASRNMHVDFVNYLKRKFGDVATLNRIWGFVYWGQLVSGWDDFPPREGILNPGYKLEWERFQQNTVTDFLGWQAKIVREYKRPDQFVTHNWPGGVRTQVNQYEVAQLLDIVAVNPYHPVQDRLDGEFISFCGDLTRSQKQSNYLVTETNAQAIGWDSRTQFPPYDGQLRLNAYSHLASGANMVAYWHWHSLHYGQETYWKGLLSHDLEPNRVYNEAARIGAEFQRIGGRLVNFRQKNEIAILLSLDSYHGIQFMPFDDRVNYMTVLNQMYRALYNLNAGVDFIFTEKPDFTGYRVVLVPPLYIASDDLLHKLAAYVEGGGRVVMAFKSGFANEYSTVRWDKAPGPLRKAAGFYYQEFSTLAEPLPLKGDPFSAGADNRVSVWAEMIVPETAEMLAFYDHPFFGRYPAITRNKYGRGTLTYEGAYLSDGLQRKVVAQAIENAGLAGPEQRLPSKVRLKRGISNRGKTMRYFLNYSGETQEFENPYGAGQEVITGRAVAEKQTLALPPWDLAIVEEK
ncbi:MAG: beta-galactosidase [Bryobacteraceae bacterium]|nr:beta-galactosidase [Bryobacteraceae bacterium]